MELEFDNEIDAILRKARAPSIGVGTANASPHVDADQVAAFAENALPDRARVLYIAHFADCEQCRKLLSQAIVLNHEADATAASAGAAPAPATAIPWYSRLIRTPNLAYTFGAFLLVFSALLGYIVIKQQGRDNTVSRSTDPYEHENGPYSRENEPSAAANSSNVAGSNATTSNASSNTAVANTSTNSTSNSMRSASNTSIDPSSIIADQPAEGPERKGVITGNPAPTGGLTGEKPATAPAPSAPPVLPLSSQKPDDLLLAGKESKDRDEAAKPAEEKVKVLSMERTKTENDDRSELDKKTIQKRSDGPARNTVQLQNEARITSADGAVAPDKTVTREVDGRSFTDRGGVWYDSAYHGQPLTIVRRGTDEYKKLNSGLRRLAESIGGTVVVVWHGKAYRIQ